MRVLAYHPLEDPYLKKSPAFGEQTKKTYYELFEEYIETYCVKEDCYLIRFLPMSGRNGIWYLYEGGVYREAPQSEIDIYYFNAMNLYGQATSTTHLNFCMTKLKMWTRMKWEDWQDHNPEWDNCLDGMINLYERKLYPHSPKYMMKRQTPRHYYPEIVLIPERFERASHAIEDASHRENYLKFFLATVHKRHEWGKFLFMYGKTGSGKSTLLQIMPEMYGRRETSKTELYAFGKRFGLDHMYDKRVNVVLDLPMVEINPWVIGKLKTLTGEDGDISVEIKGGTKFMYPIQCFLYFGIQELVDFTKEARREIDSWFKRCVLCECPTIHPEDPAFKASLRDPEFLDDLYSWAINTRPMRFYEPGEEEQWIDRNKEEWLTKCDPILRILKGHYAYAPTTQTESPEGLIVDDIPKVYVNDVFDYVVEQLENEGILQPKQLKNDITRTLLTMRIRRDNRRSEGGSYKNIIVRRDSE